MQETENRAAGNGTAENANTQDVVVRDSAGRKKRLFIILGAAIILLAAVIIGISVFGGSGQKVQETVMTENEDGGRKLQEQLDLGMKYLEEMGYEQALAAFQAVLSIEPKNVDAYLGIVEVYIRTNEFDLALETAKEGYEVTGDERLKEKIDMIESGDIFASNGWNMRANGYDGGGDLIYWYEYTYNPDGQQASVAKYNTQGVQEQYLELTYDEQGRELTNFTYHIDDGNLMKRTREYNGSNYRETLYEDTGDTILEYADVEVDSDGKELKKTTYYPDGGAGSVWSYEYDSAGRQIRESEYVSNELVWYLIYTYDERGNLLQTQCYDGSDVLQSYHENVYDEEDNLVGSRHYDADGNLQTETINQ